MKMILVGRLLLQVGVGWTWTWWWFNLRCNSDIMIISKEIWEWPNRILRAEASASECVSVKGYIFVGGGSFQDSR